MQAAITFLQKAGMCAQQGNWRESANNYRKAYDKAPEYWEYKFFCISGYTEIFRQERAAFNKDDIEYLKQIKSKKRGSVAAICCTEFTLGFLIRMQGDRKEAATHYRSCIKHFENITPADKT
eukprot:Awhi_evm1s11454